MNEPTNSLMYEESNKVIASMHVFLRHVRKLPAYLSPHTLSELLLQIEESATPAKLTRVVNRFQKALWKLSKEEQETMRQMAAQALMAHVLTSPQEPLRLEAAGWLRLFVQADMVVNPIPIFVTLVTAYVQSTESKLSGSSKEQRTYLTLIFDCFWPFRFPYPAYNRELFPPNDVFYPLAALLQHSDNETQDALIGIFAELPNLDDPNILAQLLPVALQWANSQNAEHRRRSVYVLCRMSHSDAQEALHRLQQDHDQQVRESAKDVVGMRDI
jgi:hypothetical protein